MKTAVIVAWLCLPSILAAEQEPGSGEGRAPVHIATVAEAIAKVSRPASGFGAMSPFELQTCYRLSELRNYSQQFYYKFAESDRAAWKALLDNSNASIYARMCAAYFLVDNDGTAREFLERQVKSDNLRHRYNAAKVIEMYAGRDPAKDWAVNLLLELVKSGSLDGSGVKGSRRGGLEGDEADIMGTPLDDICWDFGFMKLRKAVPVLINVLQRLPNTVGAAFALGEIGDPVAIPILLKMLKEKHWSLQNREIEALGKLKSRQAVPLLVDRLRDAPKDDILAAEAILTALLDIGDRGAIQPIEEYLKGERDKKLVAVAKRVLVQLTGNDPIPGLLALLAAETYEPERSDIIAALAKHKDDRVIDELEKIARTSDSAFMRREAITGLEKIGNRRALLALAALLDLKFSKDLKAEWGWKGPPDFSIYFPETIAVRLQRATGMDLGQSRQQWESWVNDNLTK